MLKDSTVGNSTTLTFTFDPTRWQVGIIRLSRRK